MNLFISYTNDNISSAKAVKADLERNGHTVSIDLDILSGENVPLSIQNKIKGAEVLLVLLY